MASTRLNSRSADAGRVAVKKAKAKGRRASPAPILAPSRVRAAVNAMSAPSGTRRFSAGKALSATAGRDPARVYPHFDAMARLLESESKIVQWNALQIVARLARVDSDRKIDEHLDRYLAFIRAGNLISAANAIQGAAFIGAARPDLLDRIVPAILAVERATYETPECCNVAIGRALAALQELGPAATDRPAVRAFIRRQRVNTRVAVARSAARLCAELAIDP